MSDTARPTGYYIIAGPDEPEPARWDAEAGLWFLIGTSEGQEEAVVLREAAIEMGV